MATDVASAVMRMRSRKMTKSMVQEYNNVDMIKSFDNMNNKTDISVDNNRMDASQELDAVYLDMNMTGESGELMCVEEEPDLISETDEEEIIGEDEFRMEDHFMYENRWRKVAAEQVGAKVDHRGVGVDTLHNGESKFSVLNVSNDEVEIDYTDVSETDEAESSFFEDSNLTTEDELPLQHHRSRSPRRPIKTTIVVENAVGQSDTSVESTSMATNFFVPSKTNNWRFKSYHLRRTGRSSNQKHNNNSSSDNKMSLSDDDHSINDTKNSSHNSLQIGSSIRNAFKSVKDRKIRNRQKKLSNNNSKKSNATTAAAVASTPKGTSGGTTSSEGGWFSRLGITETRKKINRQQENYLKDLILKAFQETGTTMLLEKEGGVSALGDLDKLMILAEAVQVHRKQCGETNAENAKNLQAPFHRTVVAICAKHLSIRSCRLAGIGVLENGDGSMSVVGTDPSADDDELIAPSSLSSSRHSISDRVDARTIRNAFSIKTCDILNAFEIEPLDQERIARWKSMLSKKDPEDIEILKRDLKSVVQLLFPKDIVLVNKDVSLLDDRTLSTFSGSSGSSTSESYNWWDEYIETEFDRFAEKSSLGRVDQLCASPSLEYFNNLSTDKMHRMHNGDVNFSANYMPERGANNSMEEANDEEQQRQLQPKWNMLGCIYEEPRMYEQTEPTKEEKRATPVMADRATPIMANRATPVIANSSRLRVPGNTESSLENTKFPYDEVQERSKFNWFQCAYPASDDTFASEEITQPLDLRMIKKGESGLPMTNSEANGEDNLPVQSVEFSNVSWGQNVEHEYHSDDASSERREDEISEQESHKENLTFDSIHAFEFDEADENCPEPNELLGTSDLSSVQCDAEEAAEKEYFKDCMSNVAPFIQKTPPRPQTENTDDKHPGMLPMRKIESLLESIVKDTSDAMTPFIDHSPCGSIFESENDDESPEKKNAPSKSTAAISKNSPILVHTMATDNKHKGKKKGKLRRIFSRKSKQKSKANLDTNTMPHSRSSLDTSMSLPHFRSEISTHQGKMGPPVPEMPDSAKFERRLSSKSRKLQPKSLVNKTQPTLVSEGDAASYEPLKVTKSHLFAKRSKTNSKLKSESNSISHSLPRSEQRAPLGEPLKVSKSHLFGKKSKTNSKLKFGPNSISHSLPHSRQRTPLEEPSKSPKSRLFGKRSKTNSKPKSDSISHSLPHSRQRAPLHEQLRPSRSHLFGKRSKTNSKSKSESNSISHSLPHSRQRAPLNAPTQSHFFGRKSKANTKPKTDYDALSNSLPRKVRGALNSNSLPHVRSKVIEASTTKSRAYEKLNDPTSESKSLSNSLTRNIRRALTSSSLPHVRSKLSEEAKHTSLLDQQYEKPDEPIYEPPTTTYMPLSNSLPHTMRGALTSNSLPHVTSKIVDSFSESTFHPSNQTRQHAKSNYLRPILSTPIPDELSPSFEDFDSPHRGTTPHVISAEVGVSSMPPDRIDEPVSRIVTPEPLEFQAFFPTKTIDKHPVENHRSKEASFIAGAYSNGNSSKSSSQYYKNIITPKQITSGSPFDESKHYHMLFPEDPFGDTLSQVSPTSTLSTKGATNVTTLDQLVNPKEQITSEGKNQVQNDILEAEDSSSGSEITSYLPPQTRRGLRITVCDSRSTSSGPSTIILPHYYTDADGNEVEVQDKMCTPRPVAEKHHSSPRASSISGNESMLDTSDQASSPEMKYDGLSNDGHTISRDGFKKKLSFSRACESFDTFTVLSSNEDVPKVVDWEPFPYPNEKAGPISNVNNALPSILKGRTTDEDNTSVPIASLVVPDESESVSSQSALTTYTFNTNGTESNKRKSALNSVYSQPIDDNENLVNDAEQDVQGSAFSTYLKNYYDSPYFS